MPDPPERLGPWWRLGLALLGPLLHLAFRIRVEGRGRIPRAGPAILAANHVSALDGILLALLGAERGRPVRFLVAAEFFRRPFHGFFLRRFQQIPIRRGERDQVAVDEAVEALRRGALIGIFPEGRVNADPEAGLGPGRTGVARLALAARVPVVPVGIWGSQRRWPRSGLRLRGPLRTA
ncbi:MAG TPA: lysophospholipid acyltransferase family protein, partial [Actinomycetota bacterium]|nr:lysophospholipid acyltransferase family protein [Actinomycetota bacterium]